MAIVRFPPVELADENGLLAMGGDLSVQSLLLAYRSGIFPWPIDGIREIPWFAPPERFVLFLDELKLSRSLKKVLRRTPFEVSVNTAFAEVIRASATSKNRPGQRGTWITSEMRKAYVAFHDAGFAHSVECRKDGELVGGLYGVGIGGMFAGESMFYRQPYASQVALVALVELLRSRGSAWIDCQQETPFFHALGARSIPRDGYMMLLRAELARELPPFPRGPLPAPLAR